MDPQLKLPALRDQLTPLEDLVILSLAKRRFYPANPSIYVVEPGKGMEHSFMGGLLLSHEQGEGERGRYQHHEEVPFFPKNISPVIKRIPPTNPLHPININVNPQLLEAYVDFISSFCDRGEDPYNHGTAASYDIGVLQELSRRIHLGRHIAESKFQGEPEKYVPLIERGDIQGVITQLTDDTQETKVKNSVVEKAVKYGVSPEKVLLLYTSIVIPLTKDVEGGYLRWRLTPLEKLPPQLQIR